MTETGKSLNDTITKAALLIECPTCHAGEGWHCLKSRTGPRVDRPHFGRMDAGMISIGLLTGHSSFCSCGSCGPQLSERQEILSKLERVWDLNPDKSFGEVIEELAFAHSENRDESLIGGVEDNYLLERLDDIILERLNEIIDEHENGECP